MKKLLLSIITLFATAGTAFADEDVTFEALAPRAVGAGEIFRIEFVLNANPSQFTLPAIEGLEVLAGPTSSTSTSVSIVNGEFSKQVSITYTYVLQGFTPGIITIPAAQAVVKGKSYSTKPISIEVVAGDSQGATGGAVAAPQGQQSVQTGAALSGDDIFARLIVNKNHVFKGEPLHVTLKLYSRVPIVGLDDMKYPSFNGFWSQDIGGQISQQRETYNNRVYDMWVLKEYLLYPQQSGTLTIDPFDLTIAAQVRIQGGGGPRNIFEELMGGGGNVQQINKKIASPAVKIEVKDWPAGAPDSFNGAVGQFAMDATPPPPNINANSSGTYTVKISGTGNFTMIRAPKLEQPTSFEQYTVTTSESIRHTRTGTTGYRQFEYPFIPRMEGNYTIPEFRFSYFDPGQERYITLSAREVSLEVAADSVSRGNTGGMVSGLSKEELKILGKDIRFIKLDAPNLKPKGALFMWSPAWFSLMAVLVALFFAGLVLLRKYIRNMQNDRFVRGKRANKIALKRFRAAEGSMRQGDKPGFYDEMLKALWGYMSDKLDIPMSSLTKDRIREELFERSITGDRAEEYVKIISACEEAQYSPTSSSQMNEIYKAGIDLVSELESAIKRK